MVSKTLELPKILKKLSWERSEASYKQSNFPERINNKTLEANSSFHVKERTTRKV